MFHSAFYLMVQSEIAKDKAPELVEAIRKLIESLVAIFGPVWTCVIFLILLLAAIGWRLYNDRRKDKKVDAAIEEKDRTIRRLALQELHYRVLFFKEKAGWTDEQVERFIIKNVLEDEKPK